MQQDFPRGAFNRQDNTPDARFYTDPRFVTHIDERAIEAVTQLYRELFPAGGAILDLMSSWVSHLPHDVQYTRVVGVGMNVEELATNPRLTEWRVQDLNAQPTLPYEGGSFDGAGICVSIQYLTSPVDVLREVGRVLKPGAPLVITFSNRCFPTKAVLIWQSLDDEGHGKLVTRYLQETGQFEDIQFLTRVRRRWPGGDPLYAVVGRALSKGEAANQESDIGRIRLKYRAWLTPGGRLFCQVEPGCCSATARA